MAVKDIAIIGIACRFPGAETYHQFWKNIVQGKISIDTIPIQRWDYKAYAGDPRTETANVTNSITGGFIDPIDTFDAGFFNITKCEADLMDPQQRIMLELALHCFEDACIVPEVLTDRRVGVYLSMFNADYKELQEKQYNLISSYHSTGTSPAIIANRISNYFNFTGESIVMDTACSGSLFSINAAIQALRTNHCALALAGAVNLLLTPTRHISFAKTGMLSPTGSIKAFDADADGYVRGEGAAVLLLKPLQQAIKDNNRIHGIIKGCAVNHCGKTRTLTYPDAKAQAEVIQLAIKNAGIKAETISYIEAHGTGTPKGDAIEVEGILKAFQESLSHKVYKKMACILGSVKPNIGHLEAAAGFAGVIKVVMAMQNNVLPPLKNFTRQNPAIDLSDSPFSIVDEVTPWPRLKLKRAGVSSFGFGGTNGHLILEHFPVQSFSRSRKKPFYLIVLSAKSKTALQVKRQQLSECLVTHPQQNLHDIAFTLLFGRSIYQYRYAVIADSVATLQRMLNSPEAENEWISVDKDSEHGTQTKLTGTGKLKRHFHYKAYLEQIKQVFYTSPKLNWSCYFQDIAWHPLDLPTYLFQKQSFWFEAMAQPVTQVPESKTLPLQNAIHELPGHHDKDLLNEAFLQDVEAAIPRMTPRSSGLYFPAHDYLACQVLQQLTQLGLKTGTLYSLVEAAQVMQIAPRYQRWFQALVPALAALNRLEKQGQHFVMHPYTCEVKEAVTEDEKAQWRLLHAMLKATPQILQGRMPATEAMFPGASLSLVKGIYANNAVSDYFNHILSVVVVWLGKRQQGLRILEIGAGVGGSSDRIIAYLQQHRIQPAHYVYTDISHAFLREAEKRYHAIPWMQYRILNIETLPGQQGFATGHYDIVIATNALHATKHIANTLGNVKTLLCRDGYLLLNEVTQKSLFSHLTFGLLEGWWLCEDREVRLPDAPLLDIEGWQRACSALGFYGFHVWGHSLDVGQHVLLTQSDGVISLPASSVCTQSVAQSKTVKTALSNNQLYAVLKKALSEMLGVAEQDIDVTESFADYGVDSISGVSLIRNINQMLGCDLPETTLFDHPSIEKMISHLASPHCLASPGIVVKPVPQQDAIAIIGMSGQFASADNINEYWQALEQGKELIKPVTRWPLDAVFSNYLPAEGSWCYSGGLLKDISQFDASFFNISALEAKYMDPQQRFFLQHCWHSLEDAGYAGAVLDDTQCGVYVGCHAGDYHKLYEAQVPPQAFWGSASSITPARIAYYLNLHGPAIAIDTACSSSLVAIHLASQALKNEEIDMALAGGIFVQCTPDFFVGSNRAGMLSSTGHCYPFDERASGFVPGEGVGVLVLKRLSDAVAEGDPIYGVITGSATNQDGTSNGITAPNALMQTRLLVDLYKQLQLSPTDIQLMEAHGTATYLGDPIEFSALKSAWTHFSSDKNYCALSSVKANIGHVAEAAGVAGVIKILLSMQHQKIPAAFNFNKPNAEIKLADSPFYIDSETRDWPAPIQGKRRAAISSFGFSGTNVHMVIEEGPKVSPSSKPQWCAWPLVLSALSGQQLRVQAQQLCDHLRQHPEIACGDVSYTLLSGRKHLGHRLGVLVRDVQELLLVLSNWLQGIAKDSVFTSVVNIHERTDKIHPVQETVLKFCATSYANQQHLNDLLNWYMQGCTIPCDTLFDRRFSRVSLPCYPFALQSFWVGESEQRIPEKQRVDWDISRQDPCFMQHQLSGYPVMPATAYLEKIVGTAQSLLPGFSSLDRSLVLKKICWRHPLLTADLANKPYVQMMKGENGDHEFTFKTQDETRTWCEGFVSLEEITQDPLSRVQPDFKILELILTGPQCYSAYAAMSIAYGPRFQLINTVYRSQRDGALWVELSTHEEVSVFSPYMLDAALQGVIAFFDADSGKLSLRPFFVETITIHGACEKKMWAHITHNTLSIQDGLLIVNVMIYSETGRLLMGLEDFTFRIIQQTQPAHQLSLMKARWTPVSELRPNVQSLTWDRQVTLVLNQKLSNDDTRVQYYVSDKLTVVEKTKDYTQYLMQMAQEIIMDKAHQRTLLQVVIPAKNGDYRFAALAALLKTLHLENHHITTQLLMMDEGWAVDQLASLAQQSRRYSHHAVGLYTNGIACYQQMERVSVEQECNWENNQVYLLAGGMGAIGRIVAEDILHNAPKSSVILLGRSPLSLEQAQWLASHDQSAICFMQVDITNKGQLTEALTKIIQDYGTIDTLFHIAGFTRDSYILNKQPEDMDAVLSCKMNSIEYLDELTQEMPLKKVILFSSISSRLGHIGQADYATANAYLNEFAHFRNQLVRHGLRSGHTLAISWPYWEEGGIRLSEEGKAHLYDHYGCAGLANALALHSLKMACATDESDLMVFYGNDAKLDTYQRGGEQAQTLVTHARQPALEVKEYVKTLLSQVIHIPVDALDENTHFNAYGLDSLMIVEINKHLEATVGRISKTLLFEYHSVNALAAYLEAHYKEQFSAPVPPSAVSNAMMTSSHARVSIEDSAFNDDIAIIGLAGRYPNSPTLDQFWENLSHGVDCLTEIPASRWEHQAFYDANPFEKNKTNLYRAGFIDDALTFDPLFFNLSPLDAEHMDPQERVFLQSAYEAIQDAGYTPRHLAINKGKKKPVGVFAGVMYHDHELYAAQQFHTEQAIYVSNSVAAIANRVSYHCDFTGPSITLDSMCSSSLTAIYLACQSIRNGECHAALAGGVNLSLHPSRFVALTKNQFSSSHSLCMSFGEGGDGYVPSEGVGVVVLKSLKHAKLDGDHIYAVIKGIKVNHGGKANGFTVPNPNAHASLIKACLIQANIDPNTISYIEAHGTGTALGDPIEIAGLNQAYQRAHGHLCPIGSVKSNIGHCESAAGIAALTKVLLQMKHQSLVPSLHATVKNKNIAFETLPFIVQETFEPWNTIDANTPRRAAISSFGAGGSNSHLIVEAYTHDAKLPSSLQGQEGFVLSARMPEQLMLYIRNMLAFLKKTDLSTAMKRLVYTLQCGRESLPVRFAVIISDYQDLLAKLEAFLLNPINQAQVYYYAEKQPSPTVKTFIAQHTPIDEQLLTWHQQNNLEALLSHWVEGLEWDWSLFYAKDKPLKIALPTYPFAKNHYWLPLPLAQPGKLRPEEVQQSNGLKLTGKEWYFEDHIIAGHKMLPGVMSLDLVLQVLSKQLGDVRRHSAMQIEFQAVTWLERIHADEAMLVNVVVNPVQFLTWDFSIDKVVQGRQRVCVHGRVGLKTLAPDASLDFETARAHCHKRVIESEQFYGMLSEAGYQYGPGFQIVKRIALGEQVLLTELRMDVAFTEGHCLDVRQLDAALQGIFLLYPEDNETMCVPFAMQGLKIYNLNAQCRWVHVTQLASELSFRIALYTHQFELIGMIDTLVCKRLVHKKSRHSSQSLLLCPQWTPLPRYEMKKTVPSTLVISTQTFPTELFTALTPLNPVSLRLAANDAIENIRAKLQQVSIGKHLLIVFDSADFEKANAQTIRSQQEETVLFAFKLIKALLTEGYADKNMACTFVYPSCHTQGHSIHSGVNGLVATLAKEYPHWEVRMLVLVETRQWPVDDFFNLPLQQGALQIYRDAQWHQLQLMPWQRVVATSPWPARGVYVIVGGAGGLGQVMTEHLITHYQAQCIWIGRRKLDQTIQERINFFASLGEAPIYLDADTTGIEEVRQVYAAIKQRFPKIQGVIHATLALADHSIVNMTVQQFSDTFKTKADSLVNVYDVFSQEDLACFIVFSSLIAFTANPGQCNYAAASTLIDAYAGFLSDRSLSKVKVINWGYWGNHGAVATPDHRKRMSIQGIDSIEPHEAMTVLDQLLEAQASQLAFFKMTPDAKPLPIVSQEHMTSLDTQPQVDVQRLFAGYQPEQLSVAWLKQQGGGLYLEDDNHLLAKLVLLQMTQMGLYLNQSYTVSSMIDALRIVPAYQDWCAACITFFRLASVVTEVAEGVFRFQGLNPAVDYWQEWAQLLERSQSFKGKYAQLRLLDTTLNALPEILRAKKSATASIFPEQSFDLVKDLYSNNAISDCYNHQVADAVIRIVREYADLGLQCNILEIGAGTGGTSDVVIHRLNKEQLAVGTYLYTDISQVFLAEAEKRYKTLPWVQFGILNIEHLIENDLIQKGLFHLVIATNVLHTTRNIKHTLLNVKYLMSGSGCLIMNELIDTSLFSHVTFGLLEGWWLAEDKGLRLEGSPGLDVKRWHTIGKALGFKVRLLSEQYLAFGQAVMVWQSNDLVYNMPDTLTKPASRQADPLVQPVLTDNRHQVIPLRMKLRQALAEVLKVDELEIDNEESFADYGLDSISGVTFIRNLNQALHTSLPNTVMFDYNTVDKLSLHLASLQQTSTIEPRAFTPEDKTRHHTHHQKDIAIIGISGQFASAESLDLFWQSLLQGEVLVKPVTRWPAADLMPTPSFPGQSFCQSGGLMTHIAHFDPEFFNIPGMEAHYMDPQQRLFLQHGWWALENAGYVGEHFSGSNCGVYVGCYGGDYKTLFKETPPPSAFWGNASSITPARIAYYLDLHGPAIAIDTACSSSLVAIHLACQSLQNQEIEMALAGGVFIQATPEFYQYSAAAGMLSNQGQCYTFDQRADGFVPGEGVGVVVLKRLSDALASGDIIHGVIVASGINQDGMTNGITAPSALMQEALITQTYVKHGIAPQHIQVVEAHGTGTKLGDPIEFKALKTAYERETSQKNYCALSSVKANIGHPINAAGVAGLLKLVLAMQHKTIPPVVNYDEANTEIDIQNSPFYFNTESKPWETPTGGRRLAALSSFGFSGTNAHLVLAQAPRVQTFPEDVWGAYPVLLSAMSEDQLRLQAENLLQHLSHHEALSCLNISYTLLMGRKHMNYRLGFIAEDQAKMMVHLQSWLSGTPLEGLYYHQVQHAKTKHPDSTEHLIQTFVSNKRLHQAALDAIVRAYAEGVPCNFKALFTGHYHRLALPVYPFLKRRFWVDEASVSIATDAVGEWCCVTENWQEKPLVPQDRSFTKQTQTVHVISQHPELIQTFKQALAFGKKTVSIHYYDGEQCQYLAQNIASQSVIFVLLASLHKDTLRLNTEIELVFNLSKQLISHAGQHALHLFCHAPSEEGQPSVALSALSGFLSAVMLENPNHRWQYVMHQRAQNDQLMYRTLLCEWLMSNDDRLIRYDGERRYVNQLVETTQDMSLDAPFKTHGTYVIAGGLGPVGEQLCMQLAEKYKPRIIILSRTPQGPEIKLKLKKITQAGAHMDYRQVDITDKQVLSLAIQDLTRQHGPLHGVIHLARMVQDELMIHKSWSTFSETCAAKVTGTCYLDEVTCDQPLDFFLMFSSMAAFGIKGSADYGYSAAFQNEYATYREQLVARGERKGQTLSLCWGPWTIDKYMPQDRDPMLRDKGFGMIDMQRDFQAITALMGMPIPVCGAMLVRNKDRVKQLFHIEEAHPDTCDDVASKIHFWEVMQQVYGQVAQHALSRSFANIHSTAFNETYIDRLYALLYPEKHSERTGHHDIATQMRDIMRQYLQLETVDDDKTFQCYGIDSVLAAQIAVALEKKLHTEIRSHWMLDYPSISSFSDFLLTQLSENDVRY